MSSVLPPKALRNQRDEYYLINGMIAGLMVRAADQFPSVVNVEIEDDDEGYHSTCLLTGASGARYRIILEPLESAEDDVKALRKELQR